MATTRAIYRLMSKTSYATSGIELLSGPLIRANTHGSVAAMVSLVKRQYSTVNACVSHFGYKQQPAAQPSTIYGYQTNVSLQYLICCYRLNVFRCDSDVWRHTTIVDFVFVYECFAQNSGWKLLVF